MTTTLITGANKGLGYETVRMAQVTPNGPTGTYVDKHGAPLW
jgi:hypothetical protein